MPELRQGTRSGADWASPLGTFSFRFLNRTDEFGRLRGWIKNFALTELVDPRINPG